MTKKILVVDDMGSVRSLIRDILRGENFEVFEAENGLSALQKIAETSPDLVILDLLMPEMDGLECCRRIKNNNSTRDLPVVIITSLGAKEQEREAASAGADSFLSKPIRKERLLGKIWLLLKMKERQPSESQS